MTPLRKALVTGLVTVLGAGSAMALSACSTDDIFGDDDNQVDVSLTERDLKPGQVEVDAGSVKFEVKNDGDRLHEFAVETRDGVKRITEIKPGETETLTVDLSAGRYRMYDPRGGYRKRGVNGTVVVTADNTETVNERTVERTVTEEDAPDVIVPEPDEPEVQEPEIQEPPPAPQPPQAPPPPPVVTQTVPAPPPPPAETTP
jgi:uncharacterized cupredoxin-like copper-binding protein